MNTEVNYELAKLLKDKGFKGSTQANWWILQKDHHENYAKRLPVDESKVFFAKNSDDLNLKIQIDEEREHNVFHVLSGPTISEVVMWLYEKRGIWIDVRYMDDLSKFGFCATTLKDNTEQAELYFFNSPPEAYEAGIKQVLENLI